MRLAFVSHTYIVDLNLGKIRAMVRQAPDLEVLVIVPAIWQPGGVQSGIIQTKELNEERLRRLPVKNFFKHNQGMLCFGPEYFRLLEEFKPDFIQIEQGAKSLAYAQTIAFDRIKRNHTGHIFFTHWNLPYQLHFPVNLLEGFNLANSDAILTGTYDGADLLRQKGFQKPIEIIPQLGVDLDTFFPGNAQHSRQQLGLNANSYVIGYMGRLVPEKGLMTLLKACLQLVEAQPDRDWLLLLVGQGPLQSQMEEFIAGTALSGKVTFTGAVPHSDVATYMRAMDVMVLPSETDYTFKTLTARGWKEQFGHVLIEAMACKIAVIGSDSGEIPRVLGDAGLIFPEKDWLKLSQCISTLASDNLLSSQLSERGLNRSITEYSDDSIAKRHLAFFRKLLHERKQIAR